MRSKPMILTALLLAAFLINLDTTLVNVALPAQPAQPAHRDALPGAATAQATAK